MEIEAIIKIVEILGVAGVCLLLIFKYFIPEVNSLRNQNKENEEVIRDILTKNITTIQKFMNDQQSHKESLKNTEVKMLELIKTTETNNEKRHNSLIQHLRDMQESFAKQLENYNK